MKLLPGILNLLSFRLGIGSVCVAFWVVILGTLETLGPLIQSDLGDAGALAVLLAMGTGTAMMHRRYSLAWVGWLVGALKRGWRSIAEMTIQLGVDFRESPPIPSRVPRVLLTLCGVIGLLAIAAVAGSFFLPSSLRALLAPRSYVIFIGLLGILWGALSAATLLTLFLAVAAIHDLFVTRTVRPRTRRMIRIELAVLIAALLAVASLSLWLPAWFPIVWLLSISLFCSVCLYLPGSPSLALLWKGRSKVDQVWSIDHRAIVTLYLFGSVGLLVTLFLVSRGEVVWSQQTVIYSSAMPVTSTLGYLLSWGIFAGGAALAMQFLQSVLSGRVLNPARSTLPRLFVTGVAKTDAAILNGLRTAGWQVRTPPREPARNEVPVQLVDDPPEQADSWPMRVSRTDILDEEVQFRLRRRNEVLQRRALVKGIRKLFKVVSQKELSSGSGFWFAPHYWFIPGLTRDLSEEDIDLADGRLQTDILGPSYQAVFSRPARHYFHKILRDLQIDLIFIEDGVGLKRFLRVVRTLFETHDIYGGRQPALDHHFVGIHGVRIVIHEHQMDADPWESDYPEPDYSDVGRARIMLVFRDRGESFEKPDVPTDSHGVPLPELIGV